MSSKTKKEATIKKVKIHEKDTGSPEVQVALCTDRIDEIADHLKKNPKDTQARHRLLKIVADRRKQLKYLQKSSPQRYAVVVKEINKQKK